MRRLSHGQQHELLSGAVLLGRMLRFGVGGVLNVVDALVVPLRVGMVALPSANSVLICGNSGTGERVDECELDRDGRRVNRTRPGDALADKGVGRDGGPPSAGVSGL